MTPTGEEEAKEAAGGEGGRGGGRESSAPASLLIARHQLHPCQRLQMDASPDGRSPTDFVSFPGLAHLLLVGPIVQQLLLLLLPAPTDLHEQSASLGPADTRSAASLP